MDSRTRICNELPADLLLWSEAHTCRTTVTGYWAQRERCTSGASLLRFHEWQLLVLLSWPFAAWSPLLQFRCPPPVCTHPVCQPQPTTRCCLNLLCKRPLPSGAFACSSFPCKNVPAPPPTHTAIPLWKNHLLFKAQLKCPGTFCKASPVGINWSFIHLFI